MTTGCVCCGRSHHDEDRTRFLLQVPIVAASWSLALDMAEQIALTLSIIPGIAVDEAEVSAEDDDDRPRAVFCGRRILGGRCVRRLHHEDDCQPPQPGRTLA